MPVCDRPREPVHPVTTHLHAVGLFLCHRLVHQLKYTLPNAPDLSVGADEWAPPVTRA